MVPQLAELEHRALLTLQSIGTFLPQPLSSMNFSTLGHSNETGIWSSWHAKVLEHPYAEAGPEPIWEEGLSRV